MATFDLLHVVWFYLSSLELVQGLLPGHGVQPAAVKLVVTGGVAQVLPFILAGVVAQGMTGGGVRAVGVNHLVQ